MKHLITGGSGFIGNLVAKRLREKGEEVRVLDIWEDPTRPADIEFMKASVNDRDAVRKAVEGIDVVHHNAALVAQCDAGQDYYNVNTTGSKIVAEEAAKAGVKSIIHTSSTAVFGVPVEEPITNTTPLLPMEDYGRSKLAGELVMEAICKEHDMTCITIRPRATLGAGRLGIFGILFEWISENRNVYVIGSGDIKFQFIHAADLMDLYMIALEANKPGTYNVGTDEFGTLRGDLEKLIEYAGSTSKVKSLPEGLAINSLRALYHLRLSPLVPWHYLTYHKACYFDPAPLHALGWKAQYSNMRMLEESYDWFKNSRAEDRNLGKSAHRAPLAQGALWLVKKIS